MTITCTVTTLICISWFFLEGHVINWWSARPIKARTGKFSDAYRGDGYMVSFSLKHGWLLFGFRPLNWHLYFTKLQSKPAFRVYLGPFEIEFFRVKP